MIDDPYKILGVTRDASDDEIKQAYRRLAKQYHPDRNPGNAEAAKKMQQINAAYEQIKNPEKAQPNTGYGSYGGYHSYGGYGGYGGYSGYNGQSSQSSGDNYQQAAYQYIRFGRYREALNALANASERNARWYYLSALANNGLGNQVTALEHIRRAVSMEPDNQEYLYALERIEHGGSAYRQQANTYRGFSMRANPCTGLLCCLLARFFCPCCYF